MKAGDVVRLKSGGPRMTVEAVRGRDIHCVWFDHSPSGAGPSGPHRSSFSDALLDAERPQPTGIPGLAFRFA